MPGAAEPEHPANETASHPPGGVPRVRTLPGSLAAAEESAAAASSTAEGLAGPSAQSADPGKLRESQSFNHREPRGPLTSLSSDSLPREDIYEMLHRRPAIAPPVVMDEQVLLRPPAPPRKIRAGGRSPSPEEPVHGARVRRGDYRADLES